MKLHACVAVVAVLSAVSACAGLPDAQFTIGQGWRIAHLDRQVQSGEPLPVVGASMDCRTRGAVGSDGQWVLVHFRRPPEMVYSVVPARGVAGLQQGDEVYADVDGCSHALVPRRPLKANEASGHG